METDAPVDPSRSPSGRRPVGEREYEALRLLRLGRPLPDIARALPNYSHGRHGVGVSEASAEIVVRAGLRALLGCVLRDRRPEGLPPELWPPDEVRRRVREDLGHAGRQRMLRGWVEGPGDCGRAPAAGTG